MAHPLFDVIEFTIVGPYTLWIKFDDETEQRINFEPVLYGEVYGPLRDLKFFNQVKLDPEVHTIVWPNGAEFDPWMLHEWPRLVAKLAERARSWELTLEPIV